MLVHTQDPSDTERTRGASGEVAGATRGILSPLVEPYDAICQYRWSALLVLQSTYSLTTRLYLLFWPGIPGLPFPSGGVLEPLPFIEGRWLLECDFPDDARVVGGDVLSNHELSVEELLFPLFVCCDRCSSLPSLLEEEFWSEVVVFAFLFVFEFEDLAVLKEAFERRRKLRSFRKEGMAVLLCYWWRCIGVSASRSRGAARPGISGG